MVNYLIMRIKNGALDYGVVVQKFPQYKPLIDLELELEE